MRKDRTPLPTILIGDDDKDNRNLLSQVLLAHGYRVVCVEDATQALDALAREPIDLALLDVTAGDSAPFAVCRAVKTRSDTRVIPVVLETRAPSPDDGTRDIESTAAHFLNRSPQEREAQDRLTVPKVQLAFSFCLR